MLAPDDEVTAKSGASLRARCGRSIQRLLSDSRWTHSNPIAAPLPPIPLLFLWFSYTPQGLAPLLVGPEQPGTVGVSETIASTISSKEGR